MCQYRKFDLFIFKLNFLACAHVNFLMIAIDGSVQRDIAIHHVLCSAVNKLEDKPPSRSFDRSACMWLCG